MTIGASTGANGGAEELNVEREKEEEWMGDDGASLCPVLLLLGRLLRLDSEIVFFGFFFSVF